jgi:hypothetical protein
MGHLTHLRLNQNVVASRAKSESELRLYDVFYAIGESLILGNLMLQLVEANFGSKLDL